MNENKGMHSDFLIKNEMKRMSQPIYYMYYIYLQLIQRIRTAR